MDKFNESDYQDMFNFIKSRENEVLAISSIKLKHKDDKNGRIGEHYICECNVGSYVDDEFLVEKKICLVNVKIFAEYVNNKSAIKWI